MYSVRYIDAMMEKLNGMPLGSSSFWGARALKGYGVLPEPPEGRGEFEIKSVEYTHKDFAVAKRSRVNFYERIINLREIIIALRYLPVTLDIEIFSSVWSDQGGVITLPDEDDKKEELDHCVLAYACDENGIFVDTDWSQWGPNNGHGYISFDYLDKYFITAFSMTSFDKPAHYVFQKPLIKKKVIIKDKKWYMTILSVPSMKGDLRPLFNMEVHDAGGCLAAWTHFALNKNKTLEILDLFVLPEFRKKGVGTFMFKACQIFLGTKRVYWYISSHDLIGQRDDEVKEFLISNGYLPFSDRSQFKDCRYRVEPI